MNNEQLLTAIGEIDEELITGAANDTTIRKNHILVRLGALAACLMLLVAGGYQTLFKPVATVYVTINPSVSMELNRVGRVIGLSGLNEDGVTLLTGYTYRGKDRLQVTEELIARAEDQGFLTEAGQVTISIETGSETSTEKYNTEFLNAFTTDGAQTGDAGITVRKLLTIQQARDAALSYFGLTSAKFHGFECEAEHARTVYELEFTSGGVAYECTMDAVTGEILESGTENKGVSGTNTGDLLSADAAKTAALNHAGLSAGEVTFTKCELDREDGRSVYELKFTTASGKYEYTLDAADGTVLDFDYDGVKGDKEQQKDQTVPSASLTPEQAKTAALNYAGLDASAVTFTKTELDEHDRRPVYELEFTTDARKYECDVDTVTGEVTEFESKAVRSAGQTAAGITGEEAEDIALTAAGITRSDVKYIHSHEEYDDGFVEGWCVEFGVGSTKYEYLIHIDTGEILEVSVDRH